MWGGTPHMHTCFAESLAQAEQLLWFLGKRLMKPIPLVMDVDTGTDDVIANSLR